jgi:hypothetical protein
MKLIIYNLHGNLMNIEIIGVITRREWKKTEYLNISYSTNYVDEYMQTSDSLLPSQEPISDPCPGPD